MKKNLLIAALLLFVSCETEVMRDIQEEIDKGKEEQEMSYNNGVIQAPVSISDPYFVLGVAPVNGVYDTAYICTHPNINMWAKYKPVRFSQLFTGSYPDWWRANDKGCGIYWPSYLYTKLDEAFSTPTGYPSTGSHKPRGIIEISGEEIFEPFRLSDFIGYDHNAKGFILSWDTNVADGGITTNGANSKYISTIKIDLDPNSLSLNPINMNYDVATAHWSERYIIILLHNPTNNKFIGMMSANDFTANSVNKIGTHTISIPLENVAVGTYYVYMGYAIKAAGYVPGELISIYTSSIDIIPRVARKKVSIYPATISVENVEITINSYSAVQTGTSGNYKITYTFTYTLTNNNSAAITIPKIRINFSGRSTNSYPGTVDSTLEYVGSAASVKNNVVLQMGDNVFTETLTANITSSQLGDEKTLAIYLAKSSTSSESSGTDWKLKYIATTIK